MIRMTLHQFRYDLRTFIRSRQSQFFTWRCLSCSW